MNSEREKDTSASNRLPRSRDSRSAGDPAHIVESLAFSGDGPKVEDMENALRGLDVIYDTAVVRVPDDGQGEAAQAFIVRGNEVELDESGIKQAIRKKLPQQMVPKYITIIERLPKDESGRVLKDELAGVQVRIAQPTVPDELGPPEISVKGMGDFDQATWDAYVVSHQNSSPYHLSAFLRAVVQTYHLKAFFVTARRKGKVCGVLPLFHIPSLLMTPSLVSLPYCDYGGVLADDDQTLGSLLDVARDLRAKIKAPLLELRQTCQLPAEKVSNLGKHTVCSTEKVRMALKLEGTADSFFRKIPAKLRAQVRRPQKEGCSVRTGGMELLDDFYRVFTYNMRGLGSPVHPKSMMGNVLNEFGEYARLFVVYSKDKAPIACAMALFYEHMVVNPWASSDRRYQRIAPNMLLYWSMISYALERNYRVFDFGRSSEGEGTYRFKQQWGAEPEQLWWYSTYAGGIPPEESGDSGNRKKFIAVWRKLPLKATTVLGPMLRKGISL